MKNLIALAPLALLAACGQTPAENLAEQHGIPVEEAQAAIDDAQARAARVEAVRQEDPTLNWVSIGISTGKVSESLTTRVHRTYKDCAAFSPESDNQCVPINALPQSYWDAEKTQ
jgi:hypothetical protein